MIRLLLLVALFAPVLAYGQPQQERLTAAKQLARLLQLDRLFQTYLAACESPENTPFDPRLAFKSDPGGFGGISPQSAYWPDVERIYASYRATACAYATSEKYAQYFEEQYARRLSLEDLRAAIAFYSSPTGKRLQDAVVAADHDFQSYASKLMLEAYEIANTQYQRDIRDLQRRYRASPK
jgi:hypothetical protein